MESFIFNNFKNRLMNGDVNAKENWFFYPVNKSFVNDFEDKIKYIKHTNDFRLFLPDDKEDSSNFFDYYKTKMYSQTYRYTKMGDTDLKSKPYFVTSDGFEAFLTRFPGQDHLKDLFFTPGINFYRPDHTIEKLDQTTGEVIYEVIPRGFYYVNTVEELAWCADQVNNATGNNTINIVLGDNIGTYKAGVTLADLENNPTLFKTIRYTIGANPSQPYEGVFYGNGFKFVNLIINCDKDVNGIFGYIGQNGWISTAVFDGVNVLKCSKEISITHLINNGTNVYAGLLGGKNDGKIEGCYIHGDVVVNNFIPRVYCSLAKNDYDDASNGSFYDYYPNYYCYDNPGNIVPYIGYFNEGVIATYSGHGPDGVERFYWNTESTIDAVYNYDTTNTTLPLEWYYFIAPSVDSMFFMHFTHESNRINILWYDQNLINRYSQQYGLNGAAVNYYGLLPVDAEANKPTSYYPPDTNWMGRIKYMPYLNKSIKLTEQNRAAYYVSSLVGINNSIINSVRVDCTLHTSGTFVGFMGGIAGMQSHGKLYNIITQVTSKDIEETNTGFTYYKRDWVNFGAYQFPKKSIKNISSLFGSCIIDGKLCEPGLVIDSVYSYLNNENRIVFNTGNAETPEYDDYYFDNRFGAFASMVELNSSNISDMWITNDQVNNPAYRYIHVSNSIFGYKELGAETSTDGTKYLCSPYTIAYAGVNGYQYNMYGIASPLFPEIKPTYNATPSIISTCFENKGFQIETNSHFYRVGLFGIDQNIASPYSNPNFWCINLEIDLPGVGGVNTNEQYKYFYDLGEAGVSVPTSVVDRINNPSAVNFDIDVTKLASKLIYWNNSFINYNYPSDESVFSTVKVPAAAQINPALFTTSVDEKGNATGPIATCDGVNTTPGLIVGPGGSIYDYAANKVLSLYPYFGSDLLLIDNTDPGYKKTDLTTGFKKIRITLKNRTFNAPDVGGNSLKKFFTGDGINTSHYLINNVKEVIIEFSEEAMQYRPFTDVPVPGETFRDQIRYVNDMITVYFVTEGGADEGTLEGSFTYLGDYDDWGRFASSYDGHPLYYGFVVETDKTYQTYERHQRAVVPYDISLPYSISNNVSNPPYSTFELFYMRTHGIVEDINPHNCRIYLEIESTEIIPWTHYFHGLDEYNNPIYNERHSDYITRDLTAVWYGKDPEDPDKYCFVTSAGEATYDITSAATGYFPNVAADADIHSQFIYRDITRNISADNDKVYKCYGPYSGESMYIPSLTPGEAGEYINYEPSSTIKTDITPGYRTKTSAVPLSNIPSANFNWENHYDLAVYNAEKRGYTWKTVFMPYDSEFTEGSDATPDWRKGVMYDYSLITPTYTAGYPLMVSGTEREYTLPTPWWNMQCKGYFVNNLLDSIHVADSQLNNAGQNYTGYDVSTFGDVLLLRNADITANIAAANSENSTELLNYYKYTYFKSDSVFCKDIYENGVKINVGYDYKNNKAGFWYKIPNTSGDIEFNDDLNYYSNIFAFGKTLNQKSILDYCFAANDYDWITSGFSADDFEGIYVADEKGNAVMYINVGLGECPDGTTWTLSSYPSETTLSNNVSGLLLEVGNG